MKTYVERHTFIDKCRNYYRNNGWMKDEVHLSLENVEVLLAYTPAPDVREMMNSAWIPVSERMPEVDAECIISLNKFIELATFTGEDFHAEWRDYEIADVKAWMPMPESFKPYKGGE